MVQFLPQAQIRAPRNVGIDPRGLADLGQAAQQFGMARQEAATQETRQRTLAEIAQLAQAGAPTEQIASTLIASGDNQLATLGARTLIANRQQAAGRGAQERRLQLAERADARAQAKVDQDRQTRERLTRFILGDQPQAAPTAGRAVPNELLADDISAQPNQLAAPLQPPPQALPLPVDPAVSGETRQSAAALAASGDFDGAIKLMQDARKNSPQAIAERTRVQESVKADIKREADRPRARAAAEAALVGSQQAAQAAAELALHPGLDRATGSIQGQLPSFSQGAADFDASLDTLKTQIFVQAINEMRRLSKTGGAVGSVTEREITKLENSKRSLQQTQSEGALRNNLKSLVSDLNSAMERISAAHLAEFGERLDFAPIPEPTLPQGSQATQSATAAPSLKLKVGEKRRAANGATIEKLSD